jgi:hypothetical protein
LSDGTASGWHQEQATHTKAEKYVENNAIKIQITMYNFDIRWHCSLGIWGFGYLYDSQTSN